MLNLEDALKFQNTKELFQSKGTTILTKADELDKFTSRTKLKCKCAKNHIYTKTRNNFMNAPGCPECASLYGRGKKGKLSFDYIKNEIEKTNEYILLEEEYKTGKTKMLMRHLSCGNIISMRYNDFQQGYRCSECSGRSSVLMDALDHLRKDYLVETEFKLANIKNIRVLSFDFKIGNLIFEYDGSQHFFPYSGFNNINAVQRDWIKNTKIKETPFSLVRICYKNKTSRKIIKLVREIISIQNNPTLLHSFIINNNLLLINKDNSINIENYYKKNYLNYFETFNIDYKNF